MSSAASVIIISEHAANFGVIADLLRKAGHQVDIADTAAALLALLQERSPDLLLVDWPWQGFGALKLVAAPPLLVRVGSPSRTLDALWPKSLAVDVELQQALADLDLVQVLNMLLQQRLQIRTLNAAQADMRASLESAPLPLMMLAEDGEIVQVSRSWCAMSGHPVDHYSDIDEWIAVTKPGQNTARVREYLQALFSLDGEVDEGDFPIRHADGTERIWRFTSTVAEPLADARRLLVIMANDVTEQQHREELRRIEQGVLEMIAAGTALGVITERIIELVELQVPGALTSIMRVDDSGHFRMLAAPQLPEAFCDAVDGVAAGATTGSCGAAAWYGRTTVASDIAKDANWTDFRELAAQHGLHACWSVPLVDAESRVLATFGVYFKTPRSPRDGELDMITQAAHALLLVMQRDSRERTLRERTRQLDTLVENIPGMVYRCPEQVDARPLFVSVGSEELTGYAAARLQRGGDIDFRALVHSEDRARVAAEMALALANRHYYEVSYRLVSADGKVKWVSERGRRVVDELTATRWLDGLITDVSDRRRLELLRDTERLALAKLASGSSAEQVLLRLVWGIEALVPGTRVAVMQYDGKELRMLAAPHMPADFADMAARIKIGPESTPSGRAVHVAMPVLSSNVQTDPDFQQAALAPQRALMLALGLHSCWALPVIGDEGRVMAVLTVYGRETRLPDAAEMDIIARATDIILIALQRDWREAELRLRASALDAAANAIMITDRSGVICWTNHAFSALSGYTRKEALGCRPGELLHSGKHEPDFYQAMWRCISSGRVWRGQIVNRCKDGHLCTEEMTITPVRAGGDEITHYIAVKQDVTERLALESHLRQAQRLESIGHLSGGMAHDFNNLLTVILGNAEILVDELQHDQRLVRSVRMVSSAALRGAELTARMLAFARRQALEPRAVDINRLVADMEGMLRRTLGEQVEIELVRGGGLWAAMIDPAQLESALLNLCINARDAMPEGGRLTIETANARLDRDYTEHVPELLPGQYIMLAVADTGTGISPQHMDRLFEPFFTTKEPGKGTGLGLPMVYGLVKQSGGHVAVYSEPGEGTVFKLYLPRHVGEVCDMEPQSENYALGGSETVLLVEDDDMVRRYALEVLSGLGYKVLEAATGPQALALLRARDDIELLFTDIVMPGGLNGRQLADAALALHPHLKVLFTSGYTDNAIVHHGRVDPGVNLLGKPYRRADLARRLRDILGPPAGAGQA